MMTEKEAWMFLHEKWSNPIKEDNEYFCRINIVGPFYPTGLCQSVIDLSFHDICDKVYVAMRNKIKLYGIKNNITKVFYWPQTLEGAKKRAEFCLNQAEKCDV